MILSIHKKLSMLKKFEYTRTKFWGSRWTGHMMKFHAYFQLSRKPIWKENGGLKSSVLTKHSARDNYQKPIPNCKTSLKCLKLKLSVQCLHTLYALIHPKLWNQVPSLDHFVVQNSGDYLCWKYKEVVCFYVSNLRQ